MIDVALIRKNPKLVAKHAAARNIEIDIEMIVKLDREVQSLQLELERARAELNKGSAAMAKASADERTTQRESMKQISHRASELQAQFGAKAATLREHLLAVPNMFLDDVILDKNPEHTKIVRKVGDKPKFKFPARDYLTILEPFGAVDIERAVAIAGSRFAYLKGIAAELQFALLTFAIGQLKQRGFELVVPPVMVRDEIIRGVGYLEAGGTLERYRLEKDGLYLVGSSEQSLVPMHADETLAAEALPKRYAGYSTCFRREAGAYGKDTKGILRVHQFDKLEMVSFTTPEEGREEHELFLATAEGLLQQLGLHYRVKQLVSSDTSFPLAKTYDIECWMPGQNDYRETHSISTATDFQSRRLNIRYKRGKERGFVHTLNGTAMAFNRLVIAIIEQYQTPTGFRVPAPLVPLFGREEISTE